MKKSLPISVCILISLALVLFGLAFGTVKGFGDDREQVVELLNGDSGLMDVLSYRGADGHNLCVVASRHLAGDPDVEALKNTASILTDATQSLENKRDANDQLDAQVQTVKTKLQASDSFLASQRDQQYLAMLEGDLKNLTAADKGNLYNQAAEGFNKQLEGSFPGWLATVLGVEPLELYQ